MSLILGNTHRMKNGGVRGHNGYNLFSNVSGGKRGREREDRADVAKATKAVDREEEGAQGFPTLFVQLSCSHHVSITIFKV